MRKLLKFYTPLFFLTILTGSIQTVSCQKNGKELFPIPGNSIEQQKLLEYCFHKGIKLSENDVPGHKKTVNDFTLYMLKSEVAKKKGIDTSAEIKIKEKELFKIYFDSIKNHEKVRDQEVTEAYYRLINQRNISHIQVNLSEYPFPADTLEPYRKIEQIYLRLKNGEDFNELALQLSENHITRKDSGYIGPVSFGSLTYPMEINTYRTEPGEYSRPFQTWPGYQIIKVHDEKPSPGYMEVSHILMILPAGEQERHQTIQKMDSIRNLIMKGYSFEDAARIYSEDEGSSFSGGYIGPIASSFLIREMAEAAFALKNDGDISPVVITDRTVHLIKRIKKKSLPGFEEVKDSLRQVLAGNQARSHEKKVEYYNRIKSASGFTSNPVNVSDYLMLGRICLQQGRWVSPPDSLIRKILFSLDDKTYTYNDLSKRMERGNYPYRIANYRPMIWKHYLEFEENILDEYLEKNFGKVYPEVTTKLEWEINDLVIAKLTEQEVLQKLSYSKKEMEKIYRKNRKKYTDPEEPGKILSFEDAFQQVLIDYQAEGVRDLEKGLRE